MVSILEAIVLGIVQGITEWLPISSSGHLAIFQYFFKIEESIFFDLMLHLGSLVVVFIVFRKDILKLITGFFKGDKPTLIYIGKLALASFPIGLIGFLFNSQIKVAFGNIQVVGISLIITSVLLFLSKYPEKKTKSLTFSNTFVMGVAQALAVLPGVSRSGSTISAGLMQGVNRKEAAKFSFLLFIPAILGASLFELSKGFTVESPLPVLIGVLTTIVIGILSLKFLLNIINKGKLHNFGWYCLALGIAAITLGFYI